MKSPYTLCFYVPSYLSKATRCRKNGRDKRTSWRNNPGTTVKFVASCIGSEPRKLTFHYFPHKDGIWIVTMTFRYQWDYAAVVSVRGWKQGKPQSVFCLLQGKRINISSPTGRTCKGSQFVFHVLVNAGGICKESRTNLCCYVKILELSSVAGRIWSKIQNSFCRYWDTGENIK
jgi:hypothetical protein